MRKSCEFRNAISLIEILISMFVLLFGLMGVASIFPVGSHYMTEGEKFDFGSSLAQNAFEELAVRNVLQPAAWLYGNVPDGANQNKLLFIQDSTGNDGLFNVTATTTLAAPHPGHTFVIDPMSVASASSPTMALDEWPLNFDAGGNPIRRINPWQNTNNSAYPTTANTQLPGAWPVRRLTLPQADGSPLTTSVAETIFRLRDDLAVELPEQADLPGIQRWSTDGTNLLSRQYNGSYSWLATVVPTTEAALQGLQPAHTNYGGYSYDVSIVVFYKRDLVPSAESERIINAEILNSGEVALYGAAAQDVDDAVDEIRPGNWICLMGVNQSNGNFLMKWYRLMLLDEETNQVELDNGNTPQGRYAMILGDDWPANSWTDLKAAILPGAISVVTRQMRIGN